MSHGGQCEALWSVHTEVNCLLFEVVHIPPKTSYVIGVPQGVVASGVCSELLARAHNTQALEAFKFAFSSSLILYMHPQTLAAMDLIRTLPYSCILCAGI